MRIGNGPAGLAQIRELRDERFGHPSLDLVACLPQSESTVHVRTVGTPGTVFGLLVYDEVVPQRKSRSPVARRMAASVPTGTVSESLPATVTTRMPSTLSTSRAARAAGLYTDARAKLGTLSTAKDRRR